ncbi:MAG: AAA family ATPase [Stenotrophobium sp.]
MSLARARASHSIVETKLHPGISAGRQLARPQLALPPELIDSEASVALICAPAGYGKTTVMAGWHTQLGERDIAPAWLSLDTGDNDTARFLRHLIAALQTVQGPIGRDVLAQLGGVPAAGVTSLLESLAADLRRAKKRTVLFLDDVHFIEQPEVLEMLHWLLSYSPPGLQYVLGSRVEPRLRLSGLRVRRRLLDVGTAQLGLSADEAERFLSMRLGMSLAAGPMQQLMRKTEGWIAALELVAVALRSQSQPEELIAQFAGTDRSIVDYLGEMVLGGLDENLRIFIASVAQFDRFSAALATRVTGVENPVLLVDELRARNLFLVPLDRHGEWFRFHHLVGQFFREHLRRSAPGQARAILCEGARWLFEQGQIEEAVSAAIRADAFELAAEWIAQSVEELVYRRGYHQILTRWMSQLPDDCVDRFPAIRINYAFSLAFLPRQREVEAQLHRLEAIAARLERAPQPDRKRIDPIRRAVELQAVLSHALRDEGMAARESALAWMKRWPDAPAVQKGHVSNALAFGHKTASEIAQGLEVVAQGRRWHEQGEGYYGLAWNIFVEALLHMKRGTYREARQACLSGLELIERHLNGHRAHASLLHTVLAAVAYEFDEAEQAESHIEQAMHSVQDYGPADAVILAYLTQARLRFLRGDASSAYAILHEGQELGRRRALARVTITLSAEVCTWLGRGSVTTKRWKRRSVAEFWQRAAGRPATRDSSPTRLRAWRCASICTVTQGRSSRR